MSRIGKLPVLVPEKVEVTVSERTISVSGPKGNLAQCFDDSVQVEVVDSQVLVSPKSDSRHSRAMHGTVRSIVSNMVQGVTDGYSK